MYKIPKLLRPPNKQTAEFQRATEALKATIQPIPKIEEDQPEFQLDSSLREEDFQNLIPMKQEIAPQIWTQPFKQRNYLEEFFEPKTVVQRQFDRKNKMIEAMLHEIPKVDGNIDELLGEYKEYTDDLKDLQFKMNMIDQQAEQMTLMQKLNMLDGQLDAALQMELQQEIQINRDDVDPTPKLELMYEDTKCLIDKYDQLKDNILEQMERHKFDEQELKELDHFNERNEQDNKLQNDIQTRLQKVKSEAVKLKLQNELTKLKDSAMNRQIVKRKLEDQGQQQIKKPMNKNPKQQDRKSVDIMIGYGKHKTKYRPLKF